MNEIRHCDQKFKYKGERWELYLLLLLGISIFLAYSNSAGSPFIFDDRPSILDNTHIRLTELTVPNILNGFKGPLAVRPVANFSFAVNYFFSRYNVFTYHIVNILIHILNACLLYYFFKFTINIYYKKAVNFKPDSGSSTDFQKELTRFSIVSFFLSAIWAFNPLHVQSVTYIIQRMNSMATLFFMLSILLYIKGRVVQNRINRKCSGERQGSPLIAALFFAGSLFSWFLSLGCKEIAIVLPFMIFLYELLFFQELNPRHCRLFLIFVLISSLIGGALLYFIPDNRILSRLLNSYDFFDFTIKQRCLTESRVVIYYISLLFFPHPSRLLFDYDFPLSNALLSPPTTILSLLTIASILLLAFFIARKERVIAFCIFWFLGNLALESSFIGLDIIFEHRTYLPSMMMLPIPFLLLLKIRRLPFRAWISIVCGFIIICGFWTYERNRVWQSRESIWRDSVMKAPGNHRAHYNLGRAMVPQGRFSEAAKHFKIALQLNPKDLAARKNLEIVLVYEEAMRKYTKRDQMHTYLGAFFLQKGDLGHAARNLILALKINPDNKTAHLILGKTFMRTKKFDQAIVHFQAALKIDPHDDTLLEWLGKARLSIAEQAVIKNKQ